MQSQDKVEGLCNFQEFSKPLKCLHQAIIIIKIETSKKSFMTHCIALCWEKLYKLAGSWIN